MSDGVYVASIQVLDASSSPSSPSPSSSSSSGRARSPEVRFAIDAAGLGCAGLFTEGGGGGGVHYGHANWVPTSPADWDDAADTGGEMESNQIKTMGESNRGDGIGDGVGSEIKSRRDDAHQSWIEIHPSRIRPYHHEDEAAGGGTGIESNRVKIGGGTINVARGKPVTMSGHGKEDLGGRKPPHRGGAENAVDGVRDVFSGTPHSEVHAMPEEDEVGGGYWIEVDCEMT
jgi:hypothetical protein